MARKGAMTKNPPLRGAARKEFRAAQREAVASGGPMPTQDKFRQPPQTRQDRQRVSAPQAGQTLGQIEGAVNAPGQMPPDKMFRFPQPANQAGAAIGAAMEGAGMGNMAGSRSEGWLQQHLGQQQSPVFNAFPGNNPANMNQNNFGRFDNRRPPVMPQEIQDGMFRTPGIPLQNIPQMQQMYQPVNGLPQGPRGNLGNIDFSQMVPYGQRRR